MLKISDFSKLSQVSIKALRLYDQMGVFKPTVVDNDTAYRYYSASQLPRLNRILAFKDLGFSLEQIMQLLDDKISPMQIRGMLRLKQAELQQHIHGETDRLARVEARLRQIEQEDNMPDYEVVLKRIQPITVASLRETLPKYAAVGRLFNELYNYLDGQGVKPENYCAAIWHDAGYKESDVDAEAVVSVDKLLPKSDRIKVYELPGCDRAACGIHHGSYNTITNLTTICSLGWKTTVIELLGPTERFTSKEGRNRIMNLM